MGGATRSTPVREGGISSRHGHLSTPSGSAPDAVAGSVTTPAALIEVETGW
jgi:hypothetical protein